MYSSGKFSIITFEEFISIALNAPRVVGIYPEIKNPVFINQCVSISNAIKKWLWKPGWLRMGWYVFSFCNIGIRLEISLLFSYFCWSLLVLCISYNYVSPTFCIRLMIQIREFDCVWSPIWILLSLTAVDLTCFTLYTFWYTKTTWYGMGSPFDALNLVCYFWKYLTLIFE